MKMLMVLLGLAVLAGCSPSHPVPNTEVRQSTDPDSLIAERAATLYEKTGDGQLSAWTHGERVAFFMRGLKAGEEARRAVVQFAR